MEESLGYTVLNKRHLIVAALAICAQQVAFADGAQAPAASSQPQVSRTDAIAAKDAELRELRGKSGELLSKIGDTTKSVKLDSPDAIAKLQELIDALKEVNRRLLKLEAEMDELRKQPAMTKEQASGLARVIKHTDDSFMQVQYRDSNKPGSQTAAFQAKRIRIGGTEVVDDKTWVKWSTELAGDKNQITAQLKNGYVVYEPLKSGDQSAQIQMGQMALPIGRENARSDADREFPERTLYNQALYNSERSQGIQGNYRKGKITLQAGMYNSLTVGDPEQTGVATTAAGRRLAFVGAVRYNDAKFELGLSALVGGRPQFTTKDSNNATVVAPEVKRELVMLDGAVKDVLTPGLNLRGEVVVGKDRNNLGHYLSGLDYTRTNLLGWYGQIGYQFGLKHEIDARMEEFDPSRSANNDVVKGYGAGYSYMLNKDAKISLFYERFLDPAGNYRVFTLRTQYRF